LESTRRGVVTAVDAGSPACTVAEAHFRIHTRVAGETEEIAERDIKTALLHRKLRIEFLEVVAEGDARDLEEVGILDPDT
jgi:hypothetical protein